MKLTGIVAGAIAIIAHVSLTSEKDLNKIEKLNNINIQDPLLQILVSIECGLTCRASKNGQIGMYKCSLAIYGAPQDC